MNDINLGWENLHKYLKPKAVTARLFSNLKGRQVLRGFDPITFDLTGFREWLILTQPFWVMYEEWLADPYIPDKILSINRLDDYIGYELVNMELVSWEYNRTKGNQDEMNGVNTKRSKAVIEISTSGTVLNEWWSKAEAIRVTGCTAINQLASKAEVKTKTRLFRFKDI